MRDAGLEARVPGDADLRELGDLLAPQTARPAPAVPAQAGLGGVDPAPGLQQKPAQGAAPLIVAKYRRIRLPPAPEAVEG
ncbi:hypothetical protein [Vulcanimicrobium alpinum]|uniref:hypothetical protein n=1 Tax=Vulcanimicrobium alpinum TaxID=3016050 RepID=UPI00295F4E5D|nr:hypothetical protein [Vulcanimicrobium alpinum]